jgi:hypothetical protein
MTAAPGVAAPRWRLEVLAGLRRRAELEAAGALVRALAASEELRRRLEEEETASRAWRAASREGPVGTGRSARAAADLARATAFRRRADAMARSLELRLREARGRLAGAGEAVEGARLALARARAAVGAMDRRRLEWCAGVRSARDAREEREAEEAVRTVSAGEGPWRPGGLGSGVSAARSWRVPDRSGR